MKTFVRELARFTIAIRPELESQPAADFRLQKPLLLGHKDKTCFLYRHRYALCRYKRQAPFSRKSASSDPQRVNNLTARGTERPQSVFCAVT